MWRSTWIGFMVAVAAAIVSVSGHVCGSDETDEVVIFDPSSFEVEIVVGPATGPIYVPPANPPSLPYEASVRIRDILGRWMRMLPRFTMYAGETVDEQVTFGPYHLTFSVTIDESGEAATVDLNTVQMDGEKKVRTMTQKFTVHLPPSQILPG